MTKAELIDEIASKLNLNANQAENALDSIMNVIVDTLKNNDKITMVGFGTFSVSERKQCTARNPKTGEVIEVKTIKVPHFKVGKEFASKISK